MRASIILITAFAAFVSAQSSSLHTFSVSSTTTSLTPVQSCIANCKAGDTTCQAACVGAPHPGAQQMNDTVNCVADCDQGDGSAADNSAYAKCRNACISSYIITSSLATVQSGEGPATVATVPAGVAAISGSSTSTTVSSSASRMGTSPSGSFDIVSSTSGSTMSTSASGTAASSSGAAVGNMQTGAFLGGIAGLFFAIFAL